ncbi:MAG: hypothetical protein ACLQVD_04355 [Capsulimonadaceae bacterium]
MSTLHDIPPVSCALRSGIGWNRLIGRTVLAGVLAVTVAIAGCGAPSSSSQSNGPQLLVNMTVEGDINPADYYFVLFNVTNTPVQSTGPAPVITSPWGNGFASGDITAFMLFDQTAQNSGYQMFAVAPGSNDLTFTPLPPPTSSAPVTFGTSQTLSFEIPISALATAAIPASKITTIQVNFLATDQIPPTGYTGNKLFDALGDGRILSQVDSAITITATPGQSYNDTPQEPAGDVMETGPGVYQNVSDSTAQTNGGTVADLDIVTWSVQVIS